VYGVVVRTAAGDDVPTRQVISSSSFCIETFFLTFEINVNRTSLTKPSSFGLESLGGPGDGVNCLSVHGSQHPEQF
jgi:hypothetical protein